MAMASSSSASSMASARSGNSPSNASNTNNDSHGQGHRRMRRTGSNISSTSSDILVAPGPNTTANNPSNKSGPGLAGGVLNGDTATNSPSSHRRLAWLENGHVLKVRLAPQALRALETRRQQPGSNTNAGPVDSDDGPNARGTYGKDYVQRHPEIEWVHRGQGRYLPAKQIKNNAPSQSTARASLSLNKQNYALAAESAITQPHSRRASPEARHHLAKIDTQIPPPSSAPALGAADTVPHRRKRRAIEEQLQDSLSPIPVYGLRQRSRPEPQSPESPVPRPSRLTRRVNSFSTPGNHARKTYGSETPTEYSEDQDSDGFEDDEQTFDKAYVNAHPDEFFHHVGNGWYKKGDRSNMAGKKAKQSRDVDDNTWTDALGSWHFDPAKPVHGSRIDRFPGYEFHHCGNGWYKAGAMPTQKRSSVIVPDPLAQLSRQLSQDDGGAHDADALSRTYSKEDIARYPDVEFVHRGNGRYIRKASLAPVDDRTSAAPENKRPVRSSLRATASQDDSETFVDPDALYDKSFVDAHPELEFHHRGQGRWKLGPRTTAAPTKHAPPSIVEQEPRYDSDQQGLVDTAFVTAHPNETFHHKGQGRWARGLPPPGSSNKTAVRGPGAAEWLKSEDAADRTSQPAEDEDLPGLTALVLKSEGPDKFPHIKWNYRGGGKWSRVTKQQWEQMNSGSSRGHYGVGTFSKYNGTKRDIPRRNATDVGDDDDGDTGRLTRRRRGGRGAATANDYTNGNSSKSQSDPNTPRPPLMNPEDDILGPEDTPELYRDSHSPVDPELDDDAGRVYRSCYRALNIQAVMKSLTKFDPQVRPLDSLLAIAANASEALDHLQGEYLNLEKITAPHSRIPRKPAKGGRLPVDQLQFEDRKEADLYDYNFDMRKLGFQDPVAQRIVRDAEGRELRKRRGRHTHVEVVPTAGSGIESVEMPAKRQSRQPTRFDGTAAPQSTRRRNKDLSANGDVSAAAKAASTTPDRTSTPVSFATAGLGGTTLLQTRSTAADGGIPKRIRELQRESSVVTVRSEGGTEHKVAVPRKGRPPGSKNHHKRRDAGIKKGPRKPKVVGGTTGIESSPAPSKTDDEFDDDRGDHMDVDSEPPHHHYPLPGPPPPLQHLQHPPQQIYDHGMPGAGQQQLLPPFQPQRTSYSGGGGMIHDPFGPHHPPPSAMSSSSAPSAGYASAFRGVQHGHHHHQPRDPFQNSPTSAMFPDQRQHRHSREGTYPSQPGGPGVFHYNGPSSIQTQPQGHGQHPVLYGGQGHEGSSGFRVAEHDHGSFRRGPTDEYGRSGVVGPDGYSGRGGNVSSDKVEYPVGYFLQGDGGRHSGRV